MNTSILPQDLKKFKKFHGKMAKKYVTKENKFTYNHIGFIRESYFRLGMSRKQTAKRAENMAYKRKKDRHRSIMWYLHLANFLKKSCTDKNWKDLTQEI